MSADSHTRHYIKIWAILVVLLVISVIGPMFGHKWLTLLTAFGIACVKAFLVCKHFMHLDIEKPMIRWMLITSLVFMGLFFAGTAPDVMEHTGHHWVNDAALAAAERGVGGGHHGEGHEAAGHGAEGHGAEGHGAGGHAAEGHGAATAATHDAHAGTGTEEAGAADAVAGDTTAADATAADTTAADATADASAGAPGFDAAAAFKSSCSTCHGEAGDGDGPVGAALNPKPANFTDPAFWETRDDAELHKAIKEGGAAVGRSPVMAPWGSTYDDAQIDALVAYLHTFNAAAGQGGEAAP